MNSHYLRSRLIQSLITICIVLIINFLIFRILPGDPARLLVGTRLGEHLDPTLLIAARERMGINRPVFPDQLVAYLIQLGTGDLGFSFKYTGRLVTDLIGERMGPSIVVMGLAEVVSIVLGVALGALNGWRRGTKTDLLGTNISLVLAVIPGFWLGMLLMIGLATTLHWLPTSGMFTAGASYPDILARVLDGGRHAILPVLTMAIGGVGGLALIMRSSLIETIGEDYITTARAKGHSSMGVLWEHAMPNALLPVATIVALSLGGIVTGSVLIETVFSWPGLGLLTMEALGSRDYPVLQAIFLLSTVSVIMANLCADLVYAVLDPRVRA